MFSDESELCVSFGNQGSRVWFKSGEEQKPKTKKSLVKIQSTVLKGRKVVKSVPLDHRHHVFGGPKS